MKSAMEIAAKELKYMIDLSNANMRHIPGPVFNVKGYGAKGDGVTDDSKAFQKALDEIMEIEGGTLFIPEGEFVIGKRIFTSKRFSKAAGDGLVIRGVGRGASVVRVRNGDGFFKWEQTGARAINITIEDLTIYAANGGNSGTAFELYVPPGGNHHHRDLLARNLTILPEDISKDYFDRTFFCTGLFRPYFHNVTSSGPFGPGVSEEIQKQGTAVFDVIDCYGPVFEKCTAWGCQYGFRYQVNENPGGEGGNFVDCTADSKVGFYISSAGNEPGIKITGCHANCNEAGIRINKKKLGFIKDCLLYNEENTSYVDIDLIGCEDITLQNNTYHFGVNPSRKMVNIDSNCKRIFVEDEKFRAMGTAVSLESGADEVYIKKPWFSDIVNTRIEDKGATNLHVNHIKKLYARLSLSSSMTIPDSSMTAIIWDNVDVNVDDWIEIISDKIIIPSELGIRKIRITTNIRWVNNSNGYRQVRITKNGSDFLGQPDEIKSAINISNQNIASGIIEVEEGDVLRVVVYQNSGSGLNISSLGATWCTIEVVE